MRNGLERVDADVHPHFDRGVATLEPYLDAAGKRRVLGSAFGQAWAAEAYASQFTLPKNDLYINPGGVMRRDTYTPDGSVPGSDPDLLVEQLVEGCDVDRAVLTCGNTMGLGALADPDLAARVASAVNEWMLERWLQHDRRLRGSLLVAPQDATLAAAEIDRMAGRDGFVQVHMPMREGLIGERHYWPIYAAAERHGLPVAIHPNSVDTIYRHAPNIAGGTPTYYIEWHSTLTEIFQAAVISLVCQGVFERFPGLKVVVTEGGFAWLVDVLWRMDKNWESLREEVPWLKRRPSEYVFDHVRFTTQPFPEPERPEHLAAVCEIVQADRTLLFSSDYPHWDFDNPLRAIAKLPEQTRRRVQADNAVELYGDRLL
ncbi:MAG TPA: amidohydrolase family protein [Solirubrobacteraceae bacterium]|jgi:predicted TIM-barrel fold metal-dependent hydrolase|nr:amidohydrolase family protein [Solirubrobacteraceae bacterium]